MTKHHQAKSSRLSTAVISWIILTIIFGISLFIRIYFPYDLVFAGDWVRFRDTDPWLYMRLLDNAARNFPHFPTFDPYLAYPDGSYIGLPPFWLWLLTLVAWIIGLGSPSQKVIDLVGAYLPAIFGALIVFPVYFIGKEVFNRWTGLLCAGLIAIMPGTFLSRTLLGMPDHHTAEILFSTLTMMFLILAVKRAREERISFNHLLPKNWNIANKPLLYASLAGISLGLYLLSWAGALLFVLIIFCYFIVQLIVDHLRHYSTNYLGIISGLVFLIASVMLFSGHAPAWQNPLYQASLLIALVTPVVLSILSQLMVNKRIKPAFYPIGVMGLGVVSLAVFYIINPNLVKEILGSLRLLAFAADPRIAETMSILFPAGVFTLKPAWVNFTTGFFITFISLGLLTYEVIKRDNPDKTALLVWSLIITALGLGMIRWGYYFAVIVALLTGYFAGKILEFAGVKEPAPQVVPKLKKVKAKPKISRPRISRTNLAIALIVILFLIFVPNLTNVSLTIEGGWLEGPIASTIYEDLYRALIWLKTNTPEPFPEPDFYYQRYQAPPPGQPYNYPPSTYTIMSIWGHGYFILRVAQRLPVGDPGGRGERNDAFLLAQDESSANKIMDDFKVKYVILDYTLTTKLPPKAEFQGLPPFLDTYYQQEKDGTLTPISFYHSSYYQSIASRLYHFDGKTVTPGSVTVISYQEVTTRDGKTLKLITNLLTFPSYELAKAYIAKQKPGTHQIVSANPYVSPIPLEPLKHYKLIYESPATLPVGKDKPVPKVKIFEYIKG